MTLANLFNIDIRRVGGLTWVRVGRLTFAFNVAREYRPFASAPKRERPPSATRRRRSSGP